MNRQSLSFLVLTALVSGPGPGLAQSETSAEVPRYDVEVVIFKNIQVPKSREFVYLDIFEYDHFRLENA